MSVSAISGLFQGIRDRLASHPQPLRFLIAGAMNTLFGLSIYPILLLAVPYLRQHYLVGLGIAQAISLCVAFVMYKITVFHSRGGALGEFVRFLPFYLVNYALNWLGLPVLVHSGGLDPIVAQLAFTAALMVGSYFWHSRITFRRVS